ncbi:hypothetical protein UF75_2257 [Desulfosporosinus sp. I2]|uniref:hypothetical protein n=1 Tax=Desulfosporosinus sp. I2 TaxID=1617025 RepID=UPI0005EE5EBA|nr:hypothetical protein [Desulfosporosinus sp. I2]KJR47344.1 hypothetical protein UF75_2257 [Desulfosporosinus sp. I2]
MTRFVTFLDKQTYYKSDAMTGSYSLPKMGVWQALPFNKRLGLVAFLLISVQIFRYLVFKYLLEILL